MLLSACNYLINYIVWYQDLLLTEGVIVVYEIISLTEREIVDTQGYEIETGAIGLGEFQECDPYDCNPDIFDWLFMCAFFETLFHFIIFDILKLLYR